jgi:Tol biopolymer transport system component
MNRNVEDPQVRDPRPSPTDRLDSWKEIASYLKCSVRTVRRWEEEGLPVHRHTHKKKPGIYAYKAEIDAWWRNGHERQNGRECLEQVEKTANPARDAFRSKLLRPRALLALLVTIGVGLGTWLWRAWQDPPLEIGRFVRLTHDGHDKRGNLSDGIPSPIVTDGTRLYFVESRTGFSDLVQVLANGGEVLPISSPFGNVRLTDISPDRTHLLVGNRESPTAPEHAFYSLPIGGGTAQRLGDFQAHDASWSPNGLYLAYATNDHLILAKFDGSTWKEVAQGLGTIWWLRWSPDSARLRFTVTQPKTQINSIWEIASDGTHLRDVSRDWNLSGDQCCGSWTPDQRYFVFQSSLWSGMTLKAVSERHLPFRRPLIRSLRSGPIWASAPSTSADGKKLFFVGWQPHTEAIRYDPKQKSFVSFLSGISAEALDFSKDGNWVAYTQYPEGSLWRARSDGSERVQLTSGPLYVFRPRWSPDGAKLVFFGPAPGHPWKLYLVSKAGGTPKQLISDDANEGDPTWSPDGTRLAFGRLPWMPGYAETASLFILDLDSMYISTVPGSENLFSPRWSPSGRYLAALSADSSKLMLYDFQSRNWRQLAQGSLGNPEWLGDDTLLSAVDVQNMRIIRIRVSDGATEPVANLQNERPAITSVGIWTGLAPDGSLLTLRDLSTQELYSVEVNSDESRK